MVLNNSRVLGLVVMMVMVMVMVCGGTTPQAKCRSAIVSLSPCISYVCGNSSAPSSSCCSHLANVVNSKPHCLCALISGGHSSTGIKFNETLALGLPDACKVHTPPINRCDGNENGIGNGTQNSVPPPTSEGTAKNLPFYFSYVILTITLNIFHLF